MNYPVGVLLHFYQSNVSTASWGTQRPSPPAPDAHPSGATATVPAPASARFSWGSAHILTWLLARAPGSSLNQHKDSAPWPCPTAALHHRAVHHLAWFMTGLNPCLHSPQCWPWGPTPGFGSWWCQQTYGFLTFSLNHELLVQFFVVFWNSLLHLFFLHYLCLVYPPPFSKQGIIKPPLRPSFSCRPPAGSHPSPPPVQTGLLSRLVLLPSSLEGFILFWDRVPVYILLGLFLLWVRVHPQEFLRKNAQDVNLLSSEKCDLSSLILDRLSTIFCDIQILQCNHLFYLKILL